MGAPGRLRTPDLDRAADFLWRNARAVERRLFACRFLGAGRAGVIAGVKGYQNDDGGFGHGLEPDIRGPYSQPIHAEAALRLLYESGATVTDAPEVVARTCSYLTSVGGRDGSVPAVVANVSEHPRAAHWEPQFWPAESVNPTASLAGLLHALKVGNPWLDRVTPTVWDRLTKPTLGDGHALAAAFTFLNHAPDQKRAERVADGVAAQIPDATFFSIQPGSTDYGLTPLHLAPDPDVLGRRFFADDLLDAHLDELAAAQQPDGGWPVRWESPGRGAELEWRGRLTLDALMTLQRWDRL